MDSATEKNGIDLHVTRIAHGDVFGHMTLHCDEGGCCGDEMYFAGLSADDVEEHGTYHVDEDGAIFAIDLADGDSGAGAY